MSATSHRPFAPAPLIPAALASPTGPKRWYRRVPLLFPAGFTKWSGRGLELNAQAAALNESVNTLRQLIGSVPSAADAGLPGPTPPHPTPRRPTLHPIQAHS